ncbi:unnamed protein product, partial [marine sediment metagenome]
MGREGYHLSNPCGQGKRGLTFPSDLKVGGLKENITQ